MNMYFQNSIFKNEFCQQHNTIPDKKMKNFLTAPNESMNIH
jgi:hypothetical protein